MIYGYCRISTPKQSIERQQRNILKYAPTAAMYSEVFTGKVLSRPQWKKLYKALQSDDTIIFDSVSRMSRNAEEGTKLYFELLEKGVNLVFLKEHYIDTDTYKKAVSNNIKMTGTAVDSILKGVNEYMQALAREQIRIAFDQAQKEVDDLRQRTKEGIQTAHINGQKSGRREGAKVETKKSKQAKELIKKYSDTFGGKYNDIGTIAQLENNGIKVSRNTYYKYKKELKEA